MEGSGTVTTHIKAEDRRGNGDNEVEIYGLESQATGKEEYPMGRTTVQMGQVEVESGPRSVESFQRRVARTLLIMCEPEVGKSRKTW
jgi:hypothetical protein